MAAYGRAERMNPVITSKQRAKLRGYANGLEAILQIGKGGVTPTVLKQLNDALEARELVKGKVQDNCMLTAREAAQELAEAADNSCLKYRVVAQTGHLPGAAMMEELHRELLKLTAP